MNKKIVYSAFLLVGIFGVLAQSHAKNSVPMGDQYRSDVAAVVQKLINVANRDRGIGEEVKTVATEQKDMSETVQEKITTVENRGGLKTFFIGSDYKNLGALRSELVTTQNHLDRLQKALEKTTSTTVQDDLKTQIKELEVIKTRAESFVKQHESKFSLFGWLVRLFN